MHFKKLLALLVSAALMLSLLAGCGNGESAVQALLKLLDGRYPNISIEIDHDLEADLRQAIRKAEAENAGDDAAVIRAALETALGSTITFRYLGDGQQGDTTFDLVFYAGSDPDKAAQAAYSQWNIVFDNVPDDGKYDTALAMVETENGVWMLVKATVEKAGTPDKPDKDDDEPETQEPPEQEKGYTKTEDDNGKVTFTVKTKDGLQQLVKDLERPDDNAILSANITLVSDVDLRGVNWTPIGRTYDNQYTGTFDGRGHTITGLTVTGSNEYAGLFGYIGTGGKVMNVVLEDVKIESDHQYASVGGVAGWSEGTIENCSVSGSVISTGSDSDVGGVVGWQASGSLTGCSSSATVQGTSNVGGVVGRNAIGGKVTACYSTGAVTGSYAGGVVGWNLGGGTVTACYSTGAVSGGTYNGGVVSINDGTVTACYWESSLEVGIGGGNHSAGYTNGSAYKIGNKGTTWQTAYEGMNAKASNRYQQPVNNNPPKLKWEN